MLFIIGASSLSRIIGKLHEPQYSRHVKSSIAEPGLRFKAFKQRKTVQYKLSVEYPHADKVIIWHDAKNNSLTPHHNNNHNPLSAQELIKELNLVKNKIGALVYCPQQGAPNIFAALKPTDFVVVQVLKDLLSKRKAKDPAVVNNYTQLHPPFSCEIKSLTIVRFYSFDLNRFIKKTRPKRLNQRRRKARAFRVAALLKDSALEPWLA